MFVRFVAKWRIEGSRCRVGIFRFDDLAYEEMPYRDRCRCDVIFDWFNQYLPVPCRISRSRRPKAPAICWFKSDANDFIREARNISALLDANGIPIVMLRTRRPGYIVYEDDFQIAAVPFRETRA
jgi:hypothetical protein